MTRGQSPYPPPGQGPAGYPPQQGGPPTQGPPAGSHYPPYPQRYPTPPGPSSGPNHRSPYPPHQVCLFFISLFFIMSGFDFRTFAFIKYI